MFEHFKDDVKQYRRKFNFFAWAAGLWFALILLCAVFKLAALIRLVVFVTIIGVVLAIIIAPVVGFTQYSRNRRRRRGSKWM